MFAKADAVQICGKFWDTQYIQDIKDLQYFIHDQQIPLNNFTELFLGWKGEYGKRQRSDLNEQISWFLSAHANHDSYQSII